MIFLTIGTQEPFDRLVRAVDGWCAVRQGSMPVFGQITAPRPGAHHPQHFEWVAKLAPPKYDECIKSAHVIVAHAGMGSILTALQHGKPIVIMPRWAKLKEHRNDHQLATVLMLRDRPGIYVADDETLLGPVLERALSDLSRPGVPPIPALADERFSDAIHAFLMGQNVTMK